MTRKRILVFIVAYNAETTIQNVLGRISPALAKYDTQVLIIDDSSADQTFERARDCANVPFPTTVLFNPVNQGYGGNQKIGFYFGIKQRFDIVALMHGDGQYAPEYLEELLQPLLNDEADAVFGSRMMIQGSARRGGMPLYKFVGNKILTYIQNRLLKTNLSEFHSGYRLYKLDALAKLPFDKNTNDFHFDTEIIIQFLRAGCRIKEVPIPTYYGDEICRVNGLRYAWNVIKSTLLARVQDLGILYDPKYDVTPPDHANPLYQGKLAFESPHTLALQRVPFGAKVLDVGCASGYLARVLEQKGCDVTGVDLFPPSSMEGLREFIQADVSSDPLPADAASFDCILLLDVIEHLRSPETFVASLRKSKEDAQGPTIVVSTGNVGFLVTRLMLLLGFFHYGRRGILDLTHTRLFTFSTFRKLFEQGGFRVVEVAGVPAPIPLAIGDNAFARVLLAFNRLLIRISKTLFSYQIFMVVRPVPTLEWLLERAVETSALRVRTRLSVL